MHTLHMPTLYTRGTYSIIPTSCSPCCSFIVVVITTYVPFFYIALGNISQEGLMSKEEIQQVPKCWEGSSLETASNSICVISCTKESSVMTRIADILQKSGFTDQEHVMLLKGGTI